MPQDLGRWVVGAMVTITGLFALYMSSRADDRVMYYVGIFFFIGCVLFIFLQIKQVYDKAHH
jgi:hypothetical protein